MTGGTGFLGLHLVPALVAAGFKVRLLVRREVEHPALVGLDFETLRGSLEDLQALSALVQGADVIVHAAGLIKAHRRAEFLRVNQDGTAALAQAARKIAPDARFILVSSLAAREPQLSDYAFSKHAAEDAARQAYEDALAQLAVIRPPAIYGPWDRETLLLFQASLRAVAPLTGRGKAAVIHARDAAWAIAVLAGEKFKPGYFALADEHPEGYETRVLMQEAARATGGQARLVQLPDWLVQAAGFGTDLVGKLRRTAPIFNAGKAREILHRDWSVPAAELLPREIYTPRIGLREGFAETAAWYRDAGWLR